MAYILKGRELPAHVDDTTVTPCIFCGTLIRHLNDGGTGFYVNAVVDGNARQYAYCYEPECPQSKSDGQYEGSIWICECTADYVENVGETCAACGRARKAAVRIASKPKRYRVEMAGLAQMRGGLIVEAKSKDAAGDVALARTGDVRWDYEGMDDDTVEIVEIVSVEEVR